ncbi:MAG: bifunctional methylenetetrahydrofolate dehydrogenase/methenyltetrahydrofolate cyclohydrolase FolD [Clostridia bacterium]|nr:bifunctional methylenetetrahydrofolate dehydrogenase/methenyltetrahydrofolate cyclohydrolase FolD [Clostridia bacterium]
MTKIIDGKALSQSIKDQLKISVENFKNKYNRDITLAVILVGENPASQVYVRNKIKACEYVGIKSLSYKLEETATEEEVIELTKSLSNDNKIDGILVQLPLPKHINEDMVLSCISPEKDVDGFTSINIGNLLLGKPCIVSCTPQGIITMLKSANIELTGKNAVVIGRSNIVGKPISLLLLKENCTVTICHSKTKDIEKICSNADILIAALGKTQFVKENMVKEGAVVIDVGINRTENGLKGDVDFDNVSKKTSYITPVPGGVGPMTIATLMENTYKCALRREEGEF